MCPTKPQKCRPLEIRRIRLQKDDAKLKKIKNSR